MEWLPAVPLVHRPPLRRLHMSYLDFGEATIN